MDSSVDRGLVRGGHSAMPDIDTDFASDRRQEMKEYLEERYNVNGRQRVFSAGTFSTLKLKAAIKDVARVHRVPLATVNYITAIFDDNMDWTGLFLLAAVNPKVRKFIQDYPQVIEDVRGILGQPKAASIHASAIIVTPEVRDGQSVECFDFLPIRKMDGLLVSEFDGYAVDEIGLLKEDVLATKELAKLSAILALVDQNYGRRLSIEQITSQELEDERTYQLLADGYTQNVFQFSSRGITRFIQDVQPTSIEDLIAINALYRPATLDIGATEDYIRYKHGEIAPVYNFGCYEATKNTYGIMCIAENSEIVTSEGVVPIQDIREGKCVLTEDGSYQKVLSVFEKGRRPTIRIRTNFGKELICTSDHKILTQHGWKKAKDLIPQNDLIKAFWCAPESPNIGTLRDWCLGIYLANGSSVSRPATISCRDFEEAIAVKSIFDREFELDSVVYHNVRCWDVRLVAKKGYNGKFAAEYKPNQFNQFLKDQNLWGKNVYSKEMPKTPSLLLIMGLLEGDACMGSCLLRLRNQNLASGVFYALQSFRIPSSYYEIEENGNIVYSVAFNLSQHPLPFILRQPRTLISNRPCGQSVPVKYLETVEWTKLPCSVKKNLRMAIKHKHKVFERTVLKYGGKCEHGTWGVVLSIKNDVPKNTYDLSIENNHSFCVGGLIVHNCYQEQFMSIAHTLGGFDLGKTDLLRKAIGKKNAELMATLKDDFIRGAVRNGCPDYEAEEIWLKIEAAGLYTFNRSHAAAYALTAYCGAWLKTNYPSAFYTVALQWADDKEIPQLMSEMELCSQAKIVPPDINVSDVQFFTDYEHERIFWSLNRIKMCGIRTAEYIVAERQKNGAYSSIENFIHRIFRYKLKHYEYWDDPDSTVEAERVPVNARHVKHLILAGCFDTLERVESVTGRYAILQRAASELGFKLSETDFSADCIDKHYFWAMQQITVSGIGAIDYRRIFDNDPSREAIKGKASYMPLRDVLILENEGRRIAVCATVIDVEEHSYKDKTSGEKVLFAKVRLQQNNDLVELVCWNDFYAPHRQEILALKDRIIILTAHIRYSDYTGTNCLNTYKTSILSHL